MITSESLIELHLKSKDKDEIIESLARKAGKLGRISDVAGYLEAVNVREAIFPTVIGYGIAVPYGKSSFVEKPFIAVGRSDEAFRWDRRVDLGTRRWFWMKRRPAVFFERDGVLNVDRGYICRRRELEWMPGVIETIELLNERGYYVFVVTNQSGIARGLFREEDVYDFHSFMEDEVEKQGAIIHSFYVCPHHPAGRVAGYAVDCNCRKPLPGLIEQACQEWPVDLAGSFLIGNQVGDLAAANGAGIPGYLFSDGNLYDFVQEILKKTTGGKRWNVGYIV